MKPIVIGLMLLLARFADADSYICGADGMNSEPSRKAHEFLSSIQGKFQLGRCFIEIQMCDTAEPMEFGNIVGDIGVTDRFGQFFYLSFDFSRIQTPTVSKVILNGRRMMHYEFIERIPDARSGRTEAYRLEIVKSEDLKTIEYIDLGIYHSRIRERYRQLPAGKSYWVNCGASEEPLSRP